MTRTKVDTVFSFLIVSLGIIRCLAYEREFFKASFQNAATGAKGESTPSSPWLADNVDSQRNLLESDRVCKLSESIISAFYDKEDNTWMLTKELLREMDGQMQPMIDCAKRGATIHIEAGLTIETSSAINIEKSLTLVGDGINGGEGYPTFGCSARNQILSIKGTTIILKRLRFSDCKSDKGSPIELRKGKMVIISCIFERNEALRGGTISALKESNLTIKNSSFSNNEAMNGGGAIFIDNSTSSKITDSDFYANSVRSGSLKRKGGAILAQSGGIVRILSFSGCRFEENVAEYGGAVFLSGGLVTTLNNCQFVGNVAQKQGGAILVNGSSDPLSDANARHGRCDISKTIFEGNIAETGGAIGFLPSSDGTLTHSFFKKNNAVNGSALYLFNDTSVISKESHFQQNSATQYGGAIYLHSSVVLTFLNHELFPAKTAIFQMIRGTCSKNEARSGSCIAMFNDTTIAITEAIIEENKAEREGSIYAFRAKLLNLTSVIVENNAAVHGGGIFTETKLIAEPPVGDSVGRTLIITKNCNFTANQAAKEGEGGNGGAISIIGAAELKVTNCFLIYNHADGFGGGISIIPQEYDKAESTHYLLNKMARDRRLDLADLRAQTAHSFGIELGGLSLNIVPMACVEMSSVVFLNNTANLSGGGLTAAMGALVIAKHVVFEGNSAYLSGAVHVWNSLFACEMCETMHNTADSGGGFVIQETGDGAQIALSQGYIRDSVFVNNTCKNLGGAIDVDGLRSSLYITENTTFERNSARGGGAISYESAAFMKINGVRFHDNTASVGGGAIAMAFTQFKENYALISNVVLSDNNALFGGAIQATFNVHPADKGQPRESEKYDPLKPSVEIVNSTIVGNIAIGDGGALHFNGVPSLIENVTFFQNRAKGKGGGSFFMGGSVVKIVDSTLQNNRARDGGGMMVEELTLVHCVHCIVKDNVAERQGGGVSLKTVFYEQSSVACQFDGCLFKDNKGNLGGGMSVGFPPGNEIEDLKGDVFVVLRGTDFVNNSAQVGGGAVMTARPHQVLFSCFFVPTKRDLDIRDITTIILDEKAVSKQLSFADDAHCQSWKNNHVGSGGYGPLKAGYVTHARVSLSVETVDDVRSRFLLEREYNNSMTDLKLYVTLFDQFEQYPAEVRIDHPDLTVKVDINDTPDLIGQLESHFERGVAVLRVKGHPGNSTLNLKFSDDRIETIVVEIEVMPCPIGWFSILEGQDCQKCAVGTYNFDPNATNCRECPEDGRCRSWGIEPINGFWLPFPCHEDVTACLTKSACNFDERRDYFVEFYNITQATCEVSADDLEKFRSMQCKEGHTGLSCGSCAEHYGKRGLVCRKCYPLWAVLMLFVAVILWFVFIVFVGIKGNLESMFSPSEKKPLIMHDTCSNLQTQQSLDRRISELLSVKNLNRGPSYLNLPEIEMQPPTNPFQLLCTSKRGQLRSSNEATPADKYLRERLQQLVGHEIPQSTSLEQFPHSNQQKQKTSVALNERKLIKGHLAESFKLFINFAQICSMAITINVKWTESIENVLQFFDFLGVMSGESSLSLDCLFSAHSSIPRSISKEILSHSIPFILFLIYTSFWCRILRKNIKTCVRRVVLSLMVILYVSYIGLTQKMIRTFYCITLTDGSSLKNAFQERYWSEDTSVKCYRGCHAYLVVLLVLPLLIMVSIAFPLGSAMFLMRQRRRNTLYNEENKEMFGFMFRGYREECVYWDSVIMFRKALLALVVGSGYLLGSSAQATIAAFILLVSIKVQTYLHPFSEPFQGLNRLEVFSLCISANAFLAGSVLEDMDLPDAGRIIVSIVAIVFILGFSCCIFFHMFLLLNKLFRQDLMNAQININDQDSYSSILSKWLAYKFLTRWHSKTRGN